MDTTPTTPSRDFPAWDPHTEERRLRELLRQHEANTVLLLDALHRAEQAKVAAEMERDDLQRLLDIQRLRAGR